MTVLNELYQHGCFKARFPKAASLQSPEAILINTSGGLTDGDDLACNVNWHSGTGALITTQAAERVYRSRGEPASIRTTLAVGENARVCWLPQETIFFDGGRLERITDVDVSSSSEFFGVESVVFGRRAMGEVFRRGLLSDRWTIRVDGKLVFTDAVRFEDARDGRIAGLLVRRAVANKATAMATLVYVGPDCSKRLQSIRRVLDRSDTIAGASNLGKLIVARVLANDNLAQRDAIADVFHAIHGDGITNRTRSYFRLPRVWTM